MAGTDHLRAYLAKRIKIEGLRPLAARLGVPVGNLRSICDGRATLSSTLDMICAALDLEFYIGPRRGNEAKTHDGEAVAPFDRATEAEANGRKIAPFGADLSPALVARLDAIQADLWAIRAVFPSATAGLDDTNALTEAAHENARPVNIMNLTTAAGAGAAADDERVIGQRWFQSGWLAERGLNPGVCVVIAVKGESMEPTLPDGCSILINCASRTLRDGSIFVLRGDDGLIAKRAVEDAGAWRLVSDHPIWEDIVWSPEYEIVGQVVWMARTLA